MKGVPPEHSKFPKGVSGNPKGRPRKLVSHVNEELKKRGIEPVTKQHVMDCQMLLINLTIEEIQEIANPKTDYPMLYKLCAKELLGKRGAEMLEKLLDRGIGKATQTIDMNAEIKATGTIKWGNKEIPI